MFEWLNQWNGYTEAIQSIQGLISLPHFRIAAFMIAVWALWFARQGDTERLETRISLIALLLVATVNMAITRAFANFLPYSARPIHTENYSVILREDQDAGILDGWNSMPSDHASLAMCLAVGLLMIHRNTGIFLVIWAIFVGSIPRVITALHWPSDVVVGWAIGALSAVLLLGVAKWLVRRSGIVPFFEKREAWGYPLLFLATYEVAVMFDFARFVLLSVIE